MNGSPTEERRHNVTLKSEEGQRSREAQQRADEATIRQLIDTSKERLNSEALRARQQLLRPGQPDGTHVRIFIKYRNFRIGILRRLFKRKMITAKRTAWQVPYAGKRGATVLLLSDGRLYEQSQPETVSEGQLLTNLSWVGSPDTDKQVRLFANPRRARIERHVNQIIQGLRQFDE
jgi:hypothetical protein